MLQMFFSYSSGSIHHSITNNISNNNLTIHGPSSPPTPSYNNSHVTTAQAQAVSQALSQAQDGIPSTGQTQQNQPVEFNHAINYVNKIKVITYIVFNNSSLSLYIYIYISNSTNFKS
jgi:histone deacetylase complex regulatory component SIN3